MCVIQSVLCSGFSVCVCVCVFSKTRTYHALSVKLIFCSPRLNERATEEGSRTRSQTIPKMQRTGVRSVYFG